MYGVGMSWWTKEARRKAAMASYPPSMHAGALDVVKNPALHRAIARAKAHAIEVAGREHIKANRFERVGQFITSLRSEINGKFCRRAISDLGLLNKGMWWDAGQLEADSEIKKYIQSPPVTVQLIRECVMASEAYNFQATETESQQIGQGLDNLKTSLRGFDFLLQQMENTANKVDGVIDELVSVVENYQEGECQQQQSD